MKKKKKTSSEADKIISNMALDLMLQLVRRKTMGDMTAPLEPPSLSALLDNIRWAATYPGRYYPHFLDILEDTIVEAETVLASARAVLRATLPGHTKTILLERAAKAPKDRKRKGK